MSFFQSIGFALFVSAFGNFLNAVGYILERMGHLRIIQLRREDPEMEVTICTDKVWISGFVTYLLGSVMHAWALGQGPQSLFTPMQAVTLACNTILSPICLNEPLSTADVFATFIICLSVIGSVIFGPKSEATYYVGDLMGMYIKAPFLILTGALFSFAIVGYLLVNYLQRQNEQDGIKQDGSMGPRYAPYFVVCYSCLGGLGASYNVLFMKSTVTLLEEIPESLESYGFWLIFLGLLWANCFLEWWKQKALSMFGALYVVPIFQVMLVVGGVVVGAVYFDEFAQLSRFELAMFIVSLTCCLVGVGILAASTAGRDEYDSGSELHEMEMTELPHRDYLLVDEDSDTPDTVSSAAVLPSDPPRGGGYKLSGAYSDSLETGGIEGSPTIEAVRYSTPDLKHIAQLDSFRTEKEDTQEFALEIAVKRGAEYADLPELHTEDTDVDAEYVNGFADQDSSLGVALGHSDV